MGRRHPGAFTGHRREDIAELRFSDSTDGVLRVTPMKNKRRVKRVIPVDLRMDGFGVSLREQIALCRETSALSKHRVHQTEPHGNSPVWQNIWCDTSTRRLSDYLTKALGEAPTCRHSTSCAACRIAST